MIDGVPDVSGELACAVIYVIFLGICFAFYKISIAVKYVWLALTIPVYLIGIWFYFEFVNQLEHYLRNNQILYVEFGHANLELILLGLFCFFNAAVVIAVVILVANKRRKLAKK